VRDKQGCIVRAQVDVPAETLQQGPWGYRVQVVDYDAAADTLWQPAIYSMNNGVVVDPFANGKKRRVPDRQLLSNPQFHQQNVYAIVMRILARFEHALGRRVSWSFGGHQLKIAPHATCDANAFYSKDDEALFFGYFVDPSFRGRRPTAAKGLVFTCLSHDIVAHETTHALVDGLRRRYTDPSSPDQAAFHEGISDVVALLSVFALPEVMKAVLAKSSLAKTISAKDLGPEKLRQSALFKLAKEMGTALSKTRGAALRNSVELDASPKYLNDPEFLEPHRRGEILVAAMLNALIHIWSERIEGLWRSTAGDMDLARVVQEGQHAADTLLTMTIRALDYCPPVHLEFGDYLSALVTADREIRPDDSVFKFRKHLLRSFSAYGIKPTSSYGDSEPGIWGSPEQEARPAGGLSYERSHFEPMQRDADEVFRFVWENRQALDLTEGVYTRVQSVRPCTRVGEDGFVLHETVAEYVQVLRLMATELEAEGYSRPDKSLLPDDREVFLYGGGTLIFDEWGRLKYHIHNHLSSKQRHSERLKHLAESGYFLLRRPAQETVRSGGQGQFARMHLNRSLNRARKVTDGWAGPSQSPAHAHDTTTVETLEDLDHADD